MKIWKSIAAAAVLGVLVAGPAQASDKQANLYERVENDASFSTFLAAVQAADLANALKGDDSLTILAPTDEAFAKLPDGTRDRLLEPANKDELASLLKHHMIPGSIFASTWANEKVTLKTKGRDEIVIDATSSPFVVGDARIVTKNIPAENGMIHGIDAVIMPPSS